LLPVVEVVVSVVEAVEVVLFTYLNIQLLPGDLLH
jgi:hypothetical protein